VEEMKPLVGQERDYLQIPREKRLVSNEFPCVRTVAEKETVAGAGTVEEHATMTSEVMFALHPRNKAAGPRVLLSG